MRGKADSHSLHRMVTLKFVHGHQNLINSLLCHNDTIYKVPSVMVKRTSLEGKQGSSTSF